uniref:Uncharacterized protein n=1 Tax=Arundo donax TaxID=35708 RepID=A0A0A9A4A5_ARUDO
MYMYAGCLAMEWNHSIQYQHHFNLCINLMPG